MYYPAVAHNCHGKTKSHGTTNFTHGKTELTYGKFVAVSSHAYRYLELKEMQIRTL